MNTTNNMDILDFWSMLDLRNYFSPEYSWMEKFLMAEFLNQSQQNLGPDLTPPFYS